MFYQEAGAAYELPRTFRLNPPVRFASLITLVFIFFLGGVTLLFSVVERAGGAFAKGNVQRNLDVVGMQLLLKIEGLVLFEVDNVVIIVDEDAFVFEINVYDGVVELPILVIVFHWSRSFPRGLYDVMSLTGRGV